MHTTLYEFESAPPEHTLDVGQRRRLEAYLNVIWQARGLPGSERADTSSEQPFLKFDGGRFTARQYVGFIFFEERVIEVLPKICRDAGLARRAVAQLVLHWLDYCQRLRLPHSDAAPDEVSIEDLPELLLHRFARLAHDRVLHRPYLAFEEVRETLGTPRGRVEFDAYASRALPQGQFHRFDCVHAPLQHDHTVNRAIRQAAALALEMAGFAETRRLLQDTLHQLDGVSLTPTVGPAELEAFRLPAYFAADYEELLAWCARLLERQAPGNNPGGRQPWSLLLPMDYLFESFVAGVLERHFSQTFSVSRQSGGVYLATEAASGQCSFQLRPDLVLIDRQTGRKIILDTKYKQRQRQGVDPADMYQLVAYALRHGADTAILAFPTLGASRQALFHIPMPGDAILNVWALDVPVLSAVGLRQFFADFWENS